MIKTNGSTQIIYLEQIKNFFIVRCTWDDIPSEINSSESFNIFKNKLDKWLNYCRANLKKIFYNVLINDNYKIVQNYFSNFWNSWSHGPLPWGSEDHIKHYKPSKPIKPFSNEYNKGCEGFD